jgi:type IV pilus assembly protein PilA
LVELLIVVIILGVLTSVALPAFVGQTNKAKDSAAKAYVAGVEKECQVELAETGSIPTAVQTTAGSGVKSESPGATAICTAITATPDYTGSSAFTSSVVTATGQANRSNNW